MSDAATNDLSTNIAAFCTILRREHHFRVGQAEARDALRALEAVGVDDESRVRCALRLVCCAGHDDTLVFDRAFDAFFRPPAAGTAQPAYAPRHTRPDPEKMPEHGAERPTEQRESSTDDAPQGDAGAAVRRTVGEENSDDTTAWQTLRARYSPMTAKARPPRLQAVGFDAMLRAASRVITSVRLGRSRRWKQIERGGRFDLRRTIRASLQTAGDPVDLRFLGHPLRNPRFVVLIDGSRSMSEHAAGIIQFSRALCDLTSRAHAFCFSTALRDITRELRATDIAGGSLDELGPSWGGGTKIGATLDAFVADHGMRLLSADTLVIIVSDGLDAGDLPLLERAMRNMDRRSAGVVWLNPHAGAADYRPTARGMRAALPFITFFGAANDAPGFTALAQRLAENRRIAGRRR